MFTEFVVLTILIALSGLFSGAEIAMFSLSEIKVRKLVRNRKRGAKILRKLKDEPHKLLVTILIGNNVVNIAAASIATILFTEMFGSQGVGVATGIMTFLVLVFGEITPKSYCHQNAEKVSLILAAPFFALTKILYPIVIFLEYLSLGMLKLFSPRKKKKDPEMTEDDIRTTLSMGAELGVIEKDEEEMIKNVFEFGDTIVSEIMTPRNKIAAIRSDMRLSDVLMEMLKSKYTRIPVYKNSFDNMIGVIHLKSILEHIKRKQFDTEIEKIISPIMYVKGDKNLNLLMDDFREIGTHMAIVNDEKGVVKGLVTFEDLLEEIVGEIYDEGDVKKTQLRLFDEKSIIVEPE
ncbi:MAG: HlyC/CorC family transporter, partial [Candidatus Aenigmarchaeota archaeon]|nr:HlyC/CorC family transporter [Candidatus Aenigmarchaeota archaeon]